ncbi:MAG: S8 family serine peptidase [Candidatus Heimdallarchaeota archaeon]|nr:S8 family serine peptidase [Candidatus Heimdallarchaeota archaeon]MCG3257153.1 S8 family serine peptidase [Candidatus Heimdallarchaeota archaeon]MCK4612213.1 S8 family serine peptidase [Candidatus Heimdallarchaeota archaeon]
MILCIPKQQNCDIAQFNLSEIEVIVQITETYIGEPIITRIFVSISYLVSKKTFARNSISCSTNCLLVEIYWLAPGNGVPVLTQPYRDIILGVYRGTWVYMAGTSISTPYLAGIIALIITGYHNGLGSYTDPTVQKVIDILQYASSRSTFDQEMGYGYVDAYLAYGRAYTEGRLAT